MTTRWTMQGFGLLDWVDAASLVEGHTCAWADIDGFQVGPAPAEAPAATHLWGWLGWHCCVRMRFDGPCAYVARLQPEGASCSADAADTSPGKLPVRKSVAVVVTVRPSVPLWQSQNEQVDPSTVGVEAFSYDLLEVTGAQPATFVRGRPRPDNAQEVPPGEARCR